MEERNELNDIILNKNGGSMSSNKKIIFAVALLTIILVVVIMIMKSSGSTGTENLPQAQNSSKDSLAPDAPSPDVNTQQGAPLFEPVEIVKDGNKTGDDLDKLAQKLKQESLTDNTQAQVQPQAQQTIEPAEPEQVKRVEKHTVAKAAKHAEKETTKKENVKQSTHEKHEEKKDIFSTIPTKEVSHKSVAKSAPTPAVATTDSGSGYYVQVGSFNKLEPNKKLLDGIKTLGYSYNNNKVGDVNKVLVGPFKNQSDARTALQAIRKDLVPGAFLTKK